MRLQVAGKSFPVLASSLFLVSLAFTACGETDSGGGNAGAFGAGASGVTAGSSQLAGSGGSSTGGTGAGGSAGNVGGLGGNSEGNESSSGGGAGEDTSGDEQGGAPSAGAGGSGATAGIGLPFLGEGGYGGAVASCLACVSEECPSVLTCLNDAECVAAVMCGAASCDAPSGASGVACWLGCFNGQRELALAVAPGLVCAIESCSSSCEDLTQLLEP